MSVKFNGAQAAGDLIVVVVGWNDTTATIGTVTDSSGNSYQLAVGPTVVNGIGSQAIYYAAGIVAAAAGANTVKVSFNGSAAYPDVRIAEYGGIAVSGVVDGSGGASGTSSSSSSPTITTTNANDLIIGANYVLSNTQGAGSGFTRRVITNPDSDILEDRIVTATGSYSATAPVHPAGWIMQVAAFKRHP